MDGNNPKVSFIPKGSLIREESFLERKRPRSAIGIVAIIMFLASVGGYAGLYFYDISLAEIVNAKTSEIKKAQQVFSAAPQVNTAKLFRARADLANELLSSHIIVSPVLSFLSDNTVSSILYNRFSFTSTMEGTPMLEVSGEAPSYSSLAYQTDILRADTNELSAFSVKDIALTKLGTVTFTLELSFRKDFLSYLKRNSMVVAPVVTPPKEVVVPEVIQAVAPSVTQEMGALGTSTDSGPITESFPSASKSTTTLPTSSTTSSTQGTQSFLQSLWAKFKFW